MELFFVASPQEEAVLHQKIRDNRALVDQALVDLAEGGGHGVGSVAAHEGRGDVDHRGRRRGLGVQLDTELPEHAARIDAGRFVIHAQADHAERAHRP